MDRETIIKAIDICLGHGKCNDCPYYLGEKGCTTMDCQDYMLQDTLALLKEQQKLIDDITRRRVNNGEFD